MRAPLLLLLASCVHGAPLLPKPLSSMEMSWVGSDMLISPRSDGESDNGAPVGEDEAARERREIMSQCEVRTMRSPATASGEGQYRSCIPRQGFNGTLLLALPQTRATILHGVRRLGMLSGEERGAVVEKVMQFKGFNDWEVIEARVVKSWLEQGLAVIYLTALTDRTRALTTKYGAEEAQAAIADFEAQHGKPKEVFVLGACDPGSHVAVDLYKRDPSALTGLLLWPPVVQASIFRQTRRVYAALASYLPAVPATLGIDPAWCATLDDPCDPTALYGMMRGKLSELKWGGAHSAHFLEQLLLVIDAAQEGIAAAENGDPQAALAHTHASASEALREAAHGVAPPHVIEFGIDFLVMVDRLNETVPAQNLTALRGAWREVSTGLPQTDKSLSVFAGYSLVLLLTILGEGVDVRGLEAQPEKDIYEPATNRPIFLPAAVAERLPNKDDYISAGDDDGVSLRVLREYAAHTSLPDKFDVPTLVIMDGEDDSFDVLADMLTKKKLIDRVRARADPNLHVWTIGSHDIHHRDTNHERLEPLKDPDTVLGRINRDEGARVLNPMHAILTWEETQRLALAGFHWLRHVKQLGGAAAYDDAAAFLRDAPEGVVDQGVVVADNHHHEGPAGGEGSAAAASESAASGAASATTAATRLSQWATPPAPLQLVSVHLGPKPATNTSSAGWLEAVDRIRTHGRRLVRGGQLHAVAMDASPVYRRLMLNQACSLARMGVPPPVVLTPRRESACPALRDEAPRVACFELPGRWQPEAWTQRRAASSFKLRAYLAVAEAGLHVLMSDADIVWLRDPVHFLEQAGATQHLTQQQGGGGSGGGGSEGGSNGSGGGNGTHDARGVRGTQLLLAADAATQEAVRAAAPEVLSANPVARVTLEMGQMVQKAQAMRPSTADLSRSLEMTFHTALMGWRASPRVVRLLRSVVESCEEKGTAEACQDDIVLKQPFHDAIQALGRAASVTQHERTPRGAQRLWASSTPGFSEAVNLPSFGLLEYGSALCVWFTPWLRNEHTLALEFTSVPRAFEPMVEAVLGNAPSDASLALLNLSRADAPTRGSISPSVRKQLLMMDLGVWLLDERGSCRVPPVAAAGGTGEEGGSERSTPTTVPVAAASEARGKATAELLDKAAVASSALASDAAALSGLASSGDTADGSEGGGSEGAVPADIKHGFEQLGKKLSEGFDKLFQEDCELPAAPSVVASNDTCVPSAVAHLVDPSSYDACSLVARLSNFSFLLDMPQQQSVGASLRGAGHAATHAAGRALDAVGEALKEAKANAGGGGDTDAHAQPTTPEERLQEALRDTAREAGEAWEGRDGVMAEMKLSWGGGFELPEQSVSGALLHLLVCNVDVDRLSRRIDRLRIDGCADDRALLRRELKHNVATTLPSGMTLAHLMPLTKLAGGQGTHLKIHRSPTSLMPPVLLNAKKVTMKLEGSDALADRETSPRVDIYLTLCRDSTDEPFVVRQ